VSAVHRTTEPQERYTLAGMHRIILRPTHPVRSLMHTFPVSASKSRRPVSLKECSWILGSSMFEGIDCPGHMEGASEIISFFRSLHEFPAFGKFHFDAVMHHAGTRE
jgi:hypothetical protein